MMKRAAFGKNMRQYAIIFVLLALIVLFSILSPRFFTWENALTIARQVAMMGIAAIGAMFVMLVGGIDLSPGSLVAFVNVFCANAMVNWGVPAVVAVLLSLGLAALCGYINGFFITRINIPPFITTLATMSILSGLAYTMCNGKAISGIPKIVTFLGQGYIWVIPVPIIVMVIVFAFGAFVLNKTAYGRYLFAIGGNEEAAKLSGINVVKVKQSVYTLAGLFAGIAGILFLGRLNSGSATTGAGFEFEIITAVSLGGVSAKGGGGRTFGCIVGVLIMGVLSTGLIQINAGAYAQDIITGIVLIIAVGFDCLQKSGSSLFPRMKKADKA